MIFKISNYKIYELYYDQILEITQIEQLMILKENDVKY